jgi:GNAT superfamily N-acetyltransferase
LLLPDGDEMTVRPAGPEDVDAVLALNAECSPQARHRRYLSSPAGPNPMQVARLLSVPNGTTLVVERESELRVVAMANLVCDGAEAEVALLVADTYQRRGVGTALLHRMVRLATGAGIEVLRAHLHEDNAAMVATMRRLGRPTRVSRDGRLVTLSVDLRLSVDPEPGSAPEPPAAAAGTEAGQATNR